MRLRHLGPLFLLALPGPFVCAASSAVPASLQACTQESDDSRRLACYDHEMARLAAAPPPAANTAPALAPAPAAKAVPDQSFGLTPERQRQLEPRASRDKVVPQTLSSTVSAVTPRADGRLVMTLANGQVWIQGEAYEVFHVNVGDKITIKPGLLGSYHLYAPSGYATRVTRAR
ncbi:MAG TPA: hypothetical protein VGH84_05085 [Steroidobacteraceae bacterium]|jgi:hypothetical protein